MKIGATPDASGAAAHARLTRRGRAHGLKDEYEEGAAGTLASHDFSRVSVYPPPEARPGRPAAAGERRGEDDKSDKGEPPATAPEALPSSDAQPPGDAPPALPLDGGGAAAVKLETQTVATTPADRKRTKIGIGEEVTCSTNPAKTADWTVAGGGAVDKANGTSTKFTASKSPSKPTVTATVDKQVLTVSFDVVAPDAMTSTVKSNNAPGTPGPPNNQIGFETDFDCLVKPDTVSFYRVEFRENIPANNWTWPDGSADSKGPTVVPWGVGQNNKTTDTVSSGLQAIGSINDGKKFVNFNYTIKVPEDYKDESGAWVTWLPNETHFKEFRGSDQKGRGTLNATNTARGGWQGPWQ